MQQPLDEFLFSVTQYCIKHARVVTPTGIIADGTVTIMRDVSRGRDTSRGHDAIAQNRIVAVEETLNKKVEKYIDALKMIET